VRSGIRAGYGACMADLLDIGERTLYRKLKEYEIPIVEE
jgi:DNA-binding NtrC family response regulator